MELQTISHVSKIYGVSMRMLRYYEQIGLIESMRKENYAYRVYDENAVRRLQQIIILRKLRIPMKQISVILEKPKAAEAIDIFKQNIDELDNEITALSTIKEILTRFADELSRHADISLNFDFLTDSFVLSVVDSIPASKNLLKETATMEDLKKADEKLSELKDVRIIYLPPATVASAHCVSDNPEHDSDIMMEKFVSDTALFKIKPDMRLYGFNNPNPDSKGRHGYEIWATIPDDMEVPAPLTKKTFAGGLYAAHTSKPINFEEWNLLRNWVNNSNEFEYERREPLGMNGLLEEHFNAFNIYGLKGPKTSEFSQTPGLSHIDFLWPVRERIQFTEEISDPIEGSFEKCGFKASLVKKKAFEIIGFVNTKPEPKNAKTEDEKAKVEEEKTKYKRDFWKELMEDGRLGILQKVKKPDAPLLGIVGGIPGGYAVCLLSTDVTDMKLLKKFNPIVQKIKSSKWICFETSKEIDFNPHGHRVAKRLGYNRNDSVTNGGFCRIKIYPDGSGLSVADGQAEWNNHLYHWFPVT